MSKFDHIFKKPEPQCWRRLILGVVLGMAAPVLWYVLRVMIGAPAMGELAEYWAWYTYLLIEGVVVFGAFGYFVGRHEDKLQKRVRRFSVASITDYLTELRNARYFWVRAKEEFERAQRCDHELALIIIDLDDFSYVNDTWGHAKGDQVLKELGGILGQKLRQYDVVARLGGEEFGILLPETSAADAYDIADRLRKQIGAKLYFDVSEDEVFRVTASLGIATTKDTEMSSMNHLFGRADAALYRAKAKGGDLVLVEDEAREPSESSEPRVPAEVSQSV